MNILIISILVVAFSPLVFIIVGNILGSKPRTIYQCPKCEDNSVYYLKRDGVIPHCPKCGGETEKQPGRWVSDALGCVTLYDYEELLEETREKESREELSSKPGD